KLSQHGLTHPPALTVFLYWLQTWLHADTKLKAEVWCSVFSALTAMPLYGAARRLAGENAARMAVPMLLFCCSINAFAVLSMDTATMLLSAIALYGFARALDGDPLGGALWGVAFAIASLCTFTALTLSLSWGLILWVRLHRTPPGRRRKVLLALALGPIAFL